ncbi:nitrate assimilation regulatory nira, partial [Fusarium albosuccineum]
MHESGALAELIATLPYTDALELFHLLREAPKPELPGPESSPEVPRPPSQQSLLTSILPSSPNTLELELMVRHPIAYPFLTPVQATSLPVQRLLTPTRLQRPQLPLTPSSGDSLDTSSRSSPELAQGDDEATIESDLSAIMAGLSLTRADLINQIDISRWTSLPIPNNIAIRVISLYIHNDYPVLPLFHADLFLRDLVQARPYFCSRFLVSALLSWGCAYTALHPDAAPWSGAFFVEARDLWEQMSEKESVTLCNVSGLHLMSMTAVCHGRDLLACRYLRTGLQLAKSMGLVNVPSGSASADAWLQGYDDWRRAASYTAWG